MTATSATDRAEIFTRYGNVSGRVPRHWVRATDSAVEGEPSGFNVRCNSCVVLRDPDNPFPIGGSMILVINDPPVVELRLRRFSLPGSEGSVRIWVGHCANCGAGLWAE